MSLPNKSNYGRYSSDNYGSHTQVVKVGSVTVWYSYDTPVAFEVIGHKRVVSKNYWSRTTGKHLNWIDGGNKASRVDSATFAQLWREQGVEV
jgi:hypothetical protein